MPVSALIVSATCQYRATARNTNSVCVRARSRELHMKFLKRDRPVALTTCRTKGAAYRVDNKFAN